MINVPLMPSTFFCFPKGPDLPLFAFQQSGNTPPIIERMRQISDFLGSYGQTEMGLRPLQVAVRPDDERVSADLRTLGRSLGSEVGAALLGPVHNPKQDRWYVSIMPYARLDGVAFRTLGVGPSLEAATRPLSDREFEDELNAIFVPSRVMTIEGMRRVFMPIQEEPSFLGRISAGQLEDFLGRLRRSKISPNLDLSPNPLEEEDNIMRVGGRLYSCDAGDVLSAGVFMERRLEENLSEIEALLRPRVLENP
jgi:hypothetical protein